MFQSEKFSTVVFTPAELTYWVHSATPCTPFVPTLVHLNSEYETHTVLLRNPTQLLAAAPRTDKWSPMLEKALRECYSDLRSESRENNAARAWCGRFIGAKAADLEAASGLFAIPDVNAISRDASFSCFIPFSWRREEPSVAELVRAQGHNAPHRRTMNSSLRTAERRPPPAGAM
jgi:hypothetical protein